jgi:hypothetical protein
MLPLWLVLLLVAAAAVVVVVQSSSAAAVATAYASAAGAAVASTSALVAMLLCRMASIHLPWQFKATTYILCKQSRCRCHNDGRSRSKKNMSTCSKLAPIDGLISVCYLQISCAQMDRSNDPCRCYYSMILAKLAIIVSWDPAGNGFICSVYRACGR